MCLVLDPPAVFVPQLASAFLPALSALPLALRVAAWIVFSVVIAELVGYVLHRFLHSEKIRWLSRSHMEHHLEHYGPLKPMRPSPEYMDATTGRWAIGNVGLEWIAPSALLLIVFVAAFTALGISWPYQLTFIVITLGWSSLMFSYLHDRMHMRGFWMERNWLVRRWFVAARRLHDIHHLSLNDAGRMDRNFGIGFYVFDRVFRTISHQQQRLNRAAVELARSRHESATQRRPA
jgi:sterol desaturase/sphingolipid hydroxylase (fatty acid hydroxylase superfamily)